MDDSTLDAVWCKDSETGGEALIDPYTNTVVARRINGQIMNPEGTTNG